MNSYTTAVLTVIAGALVVISIRLGAPQPVQAGLLDGLLDGAPTLGELRRLGDILDPDERKQARDLLTDKIPLVRLHGGFVSVK